MNAKKMIAEKLDKAVADGLIESYKIYDTPERKPFFKLLFSRIFSWKFVLESLVFALVFYLLKLANVL